MSPPYIKDYDADEDGPPTTWPRYFDMLNWGFLLARPDAGAAAGRWGCHRLEHGRSEHARRSGRPGRVVGYPRPTGTSRPGHRRVCFCACAPNWARQRGCTQLKIETQNVNVPACRFYASQGCELGVIHRYAYAGRPQVANETMLIWYLRLS